MRGKVNDAISDAETLETAVTRPADHAQRHLEKAFVVLCVQGSKKRRMHGDTSKDQYRRDGDLRVLG
jgi:hypothetical protein